MPYFVDLIDVAITPTGLVNGHTVTFSSGKWVNAPPVSGNSIAQAGGSVSVDLSGNILITPAPSANAKMGSGTPNSQNTNAPIALDIAHGTAAVPLTAIGPSIRLNRIENMVGNGNPADGSQNSIIVLSTTSQASERIQTSCIWAISQTNSTYALASADACSVLGIGWASGASIHRGIGAYFEGRRDVNTAFTNGLEVRSHENSSTVGSYNPAGLSDTAGLWCSSSGNANSIEAIGIGSADGVSFWRFGISFKSGGIVTASIRDDSSSGSSMVINGSHVYGIDTNGATVVNVIRLGNNQIVNWRNAANSADLNMFYVNPSNQLVVGTGLAASSIFMNVDGTLKNVTVGIADSGGAGFKLLRVPN